MRNQYLDMSITYDFSDRTEILDGTMINDCLDINENNEVIVNADKVREYVDKVARKYNTFGDARNFKTSLGNDIVVSGGDYGWLMNRPAETEELVEIIKQRESVTRQPIYTQTGVKREVDDIGNTYVEIDYTSQHMWFYKEGNLIVETDVVTGDMSKDYGFLSGTFPIVFKKRDTTLTGEDYASPVSFWMPFYRNVGIHDASWRKGEQYVCNQ